MVFTSSLQIVAHHGGEQVLPNLGKVVELIRSYRGSAAEITDLATRQWWMLVGDASVGPL